MVYLRAFNHWFSRKVDFMIIRKRVTLMCSSLVFSSSTLICDLFCFCFILIWLFLVWISSLGQKLDVHDQIMALQRYYTDSPLSLRYSHHNLYETVAEKSEQRPPLMHFFSSRVMRLKLMQNNRRQTMPFLGILRLVAWASQTLVTWCMCECVCACKKCIEIPPIFTKTFSIFLFSKPVLFLFS